MSGLDYIYFASEHSQIEELFLFLQDEFHVVTPFTGAQRKNRNTGTGGKIDYTEFIFYKIKNERTHNLFGTFN
jgi:hypothetical protein